MNQSLLAEKCLCLCCRLEMSQDQDASLRDLWSQGLDGEAVVERARQEGVACLLYHHLQRLGLLKDLSVEAQGSLRSLYYGTAAQHAVLCAEAHRMNRQLVASGIVPFFVKGLYLASEVYGNVALRPMTDIDILVPENQRRDAWGVLAKMGYQPVGDVERALADPRAYGVTLERREGDRKFLVDLHGHFFNARWMRFFLARCLDAKVHRAAAETFFIDAASLETMAAELHFIYVVTHAFSHGFDRLINLADILLFSERHQDRTFAHRVQERARDLGLWPVVAYGLFHTARVLEAPDICGRFGIAVCGVRHRLVYASGLYRYPWLAYLFLR
jgi:hypothetical protein